MFSTSSIVIGQNINIDSFFNQQIKQLHIAGMAACAINNGKVVWRGYYGYQDINRKIPVDSQTIFMLASVSKTVTAAALMQLFSKGKFNLDDNINQYLPFKIKNPNFPNNQITFRQLLRHRSSIIDNYDYLNQFWEINKGDPTITLGKFLKEYLAAEGENFNKEKNFAKDRPGTSFSYSNIGYALIGYLVECISKMPFDKYCNENIFKPLNMNDTAWYLKSLDTSKIAKPYYFSDSLQQYVSYGFGGFPDYPAGELRTTLNSFSHFLIGWTQDGKWNNTSVFDSVAVQTLTPSDFSLGWHTWFIYVLDNEHLGYSHEGGGGGASTYTLFSDKMGIILLTNGEIKNYFEWRKLIDFIYTSKLKK
jgi:CubicO group peptidase (beta-lactamase class C family)